MTDHQTTILDTLNQLEAGIAQRSVTAKDVSRWSVGMQIEHCLLATHGICHAVAESKPRSGHIRKGAVRQLIFLTGWIPRGRGKAPREALPDKEAPESRLRELVSEARLSVQAAAAADPHCWWEHFAFGVMERDDALRFVAIHNRHHLKIVSDILANSADPR